MAAVVSWLGRGRLAHGCLRFPMARLPAAHKALANAVSYLMSDNLVTGTVLHAEGAQLLV
jgi:hypothetical protein